MTRRWQAVVSCTFLVLYGLGVFWGLPSALNPASDSTAPLGPLAWVARYKDPDISFIYPAVHQILLAVVYGAVIGVFWATGQVNALSGSWPYGFSDPSLVFSWLILASNAVSTLMGVAVLLFFARIRPLPQTLPAFSVFLIGLSGVFAYYARVSNMDMPYLFWIAVSYLLLWKYLFAAAVPSWRLLAASGAAAALGIGTKDQAAGFVIGLGLLLLCLPAGGDSASWTRRLRAAVIFSASLLLVYALAAVAVQPWRWLHHVRFVTSDHVLPETPAGLAGQWRLLERAVSRLAGILSIPGLILGAAGLGILVLRRRYREALALALPPAAYYLSIIARVRATEERYLLPIALPAAICAGVAAGSLWTWASARGLPARATVIAALAAILVYQAAFNYAPVTYCQVFDLKRELARDLPAIVPPGTPILLEDMAIFNYPNRDVYARYPLMLAPGRAVRPPSTHASNLLSPYTPSVRFVLAAASEPLIEDPWQFNDLVPHRHWTYPEWVGKRVKVPAIYEFYLFERTGVAAGRQ